MTEVRKIIRRSSIINGYLVHVWVGLGPPDNLDDDDYTCPEVTHQYMTRRALLAAIDSGAAFIEKP